MNKLKDLQPEPVWRYFEEISRIPRASYKEEAISEYVCNFAKERGLKYYRDQWNNVIIIKDATKGYEDKEPYILQGHMDMVCEKTPDCAIDFDKDGLELAVDGDYVYARGTTLGGDDGIAVAYALALLDAEDIPHPKLEVVLTTAEEVGMEGAKNIDLHMLSGRKLLNLDSEEEGIFLTSCAGGCMASCHIPVEWEESNGIAYQLHAYGMLGGHSGCEIDKKRANASLVLARILLECKDLGIHLLGGAGGLKDNAIPLEAKVNVLVSPELQKEFEDKVKASVKAIREEYAATDPGLKVDIISKGKAEEKVLTAKSQDKVLCLMNLLPNGVQAMSAQVEGLVETSLNLGIFRLDEELYLGYLIRSSVGSAKDYLASKIKYMVELAGGTCSFSGDYPAWEYRRDSRLREDMIQLYKQMYGKEPLVQAIHAGLECGYLAGKLTDLDVVSFGPDILDIHTTKERISITSTERVWRYLLALLAL